MGVFDTYGRFADILSTLEIAYSYHKVSNGGNLAAAPSIKLEIYDATCDETPGGDCYGTLVYEPTWNGPGSSSTTPLSSNPTPDVWTAVNIDGDNGLFWWTGGFGQPNTAGGPPIRTLNEWAGVMTADFLDASIISVRIGVGTFNQDQIGYFDDVRISHSFDAGFSKAYDFEPVPADKDECKNGGWEGFGFVNQGQCIQFVNTGK